MYASDRASGARSSALGACLSWIGQGATLTGAAQPESFTLPDLLYRIEEATEVLLQAFPVESVIGLLADNSPAWLTIDLATHVTGQRLVPLPAFFTPAQQRHAVASCAMDGLVCESSVQALALGFEREVGCVGSLRLFAASQLGQRGASPDHTKAQKITYTSGTTGSPKGIPLSHALQMQTAGALAQRLAPLNIERHLSLLPFSLLLENVAGVYTALRLGATCICPPLAEVGMNGAVGFDADRCLEAIREHRPHSLILLPQMLHLLVERLARSESRGSDVESLEFVAVGGAKTPVSLLLRARALGIPVYEGYGLSECGSVVSLNIPGDDRVGSAGKPLPGISIRRSVAGELEILGRGFSPDGGARPGLAPERIATGDLGDVDNEGFVHVHGRSTSLIVTAFGRNVSPEWPEELLLRAPALAQAVVFGDARPHLVALLVASSDEVAECALRDAVEAANAALPDYARIKGWLRVAEPFTLTNGLATANGRPRRDAIWARYVAALEKLYEAQTPLTQRQPCSN
jgi:long-chain acyl-CoA synthetase